MASQIYNHKVKIISILLLVILIFSLHLYQRQITYFVAQLTLNSAPLVQPIKPVQAAKNMQKPAVVKPIFAPARVKTPVILGAYAIQLMGSRARGDLISEIRRHNLKGLTHIRKIQYQGRPWYILLVGNYGHYAEARAAFELLLPSIKAFHPWIRPQ